MVHAPHSRSLISHSRGLLETSYMPPFLHSAHEPEKMGNAGNADKDDVKDDSCVISKLLLDNIKKANLTYLPSCKENHNHPIFCPAHHPGGSSQETLTLMGVFFLCAHHFHIQKQCLSTVVD